MRWARVATRTVTSSSTASSSAAATISGSDARGHKEKVDVHGPLAVSSETHRRDSTCLFLLEPASRRHIRGSGDEIRPVRRRRRRQRRWQRRHHGSCAALRAPRLQRRHERRAARQHRQAPRKCASAHARRGSATGPRRRDPCSVAELSTGTSRIPGANTLFQSLLRYFGSFATKPLAKHAFRDVDQRERNAQLFGRRFAARIGHDAHNTMTRALGEAVRRDTNWTRRP